MKIVVGSTNNAKISAAQLATDKIFPGTKVEGIEVESSVSNQPKSELEAQTGAIHRAKTVLEKANADLGIGLEGGIYQVASKWFGGSWAAVFSKDGQLGLGTSARFEIPSSMAKKILAGDDLATVIKEITGRESLHTQEGAMGFLTAGHLTRAEAYSQGIIFAFAPFLSDKKFWKK